MGRITVRQSILAVDDTIPNLIAMQGILDEEFVVNIATSGEEALTILSQSLVDLVVLDIEMPGMSGIEVFRQMRGDPVLGSMPVIFVTADKTTETVRTAVQLGAAGYTTKPYDPTSLLQKVRQAVASAEVDQGAVYLARKMREIQNGCTVKEDIIALQMRFVEIPEDVFIPVIRLKLARLGAALKNGDTDQAWELARSITADAGRPPVK